MIYKPGLMAASRLAEKLADAEKKFRTTLPYCSSYNSTREQSEGAEYALRDLASQLKSKAKESWL